MASETADNRRRLISDTLVTVTQHYLSEKFPFTHTYNHIRYMGYYFSSDSLVKMITWNVPFNDGSNSYICFIVRPTEGGNLFYLMRGDRGTALIDQEEVFAQGDWYGALYYDIIPFKHNGTTLYLLPGLDMNDIYTNGKVIEVMGFADDDTPRFGEKVIRSGNDLLSRMVFRYSSNSVMMLRYEPLTGWMVFDHLSPAEPRFSGIYSYYGPDSSYDALELRDGIWFHISDVDLRNRQ